MDGKQFDRIAAALASGVSRRKIVRLLSTGIAVGVAGCRKHDTAFGAALPVDSDGFTIVPKNTEKGSCDDVSKAAARGVFASSKPNGKIDPEPKKGKNGLGLLGVASCHLRYSDVLYAGLNPVPSQNGRRCWVTTGLSIPTFSSVCRMYRIRWEPDNPGEECAAVRQWENVIVKHEQHHKSDHEAAARAYGGFPTEFRGCGTSLREAKGKINGQINRAIHRAKTEIETDWDRRMALWHPGQEEADPPKCSECPCDSAPRSSARTSRGTALCCEKPCGDECCKPDEECTDGKCCASGQANCSGQCTSTSRDNENCGACGTACDASKCEECQDGECAVPDLCTVCDGGERKPKCGSDRAKPECDSGSGNCVCASNKLCSREGESWCCTEGMILRYPDGSFKACCCHGMMGHPETGPDMCNPCAGGQVCYCRGSGRFGCCGDGTHCGNCDAPNNGGMPFCLRN